MGTKEITKRNENDKMANIILSYRTNENWKYLIDDCQAIIGQRVKNSRWEMIVGHAELGERIIKDKLYQKYGKGNRNFINDFSEDAKIGIATTYRSIQFYEKYFKGELRNQDVSHACETILNKYFQKEGENISWHKIVQNYLPEPKENKIPLPEGEYQVLLCDIPWPYPERQDAKNLYGNPIYHYEMMSIKEIKELKVGELASENSVLFLWVATNFLEESFDIIRNWGFEYKSQMVWVKESGKQGGIGWYFWGDHELLLVVTKGSMLPKEKFSSVLKAPRREHSKKPDEIYEIIEKMYPNTKRIELFARGKSREGWKAWGDQVDEK